MVLGDFNADLKRESNGTLTQRFGKLLHDYCCSEGLIISDHILLERDKTFTYVSHTHGTTSWLDHVVCTNSMHSLIEEINVNYGHVSSDHLPVSVKINFEHAQVQSRDSNGNSCKHIKWDSLSSTELMEYAMSINTQLSTLHATGDAFSCDDCNCSDATHIAAIDKLYYELIKCLKENSSVLEQGTNSKKKFKTVAQWNVYCKELHRSARAAFLLWRQHNSPKSGTLFRTMSSTRAQFKRALRRCKANKKANEADALAERLMSKDIKGFWEKIKDLSNNNIVMQATTIGGATGDENICNMWCQHYRSLLNSSKDTSEKKVVEENLKNIDESILTFSESEVSEAIDSLKNGKAAGPDQLSSEHFKYAGDSIAQLLCIVFNAMFVHGHIPDSLMQTHVISIVKDKKGDLSDKDNYRPIAITCVASKILELLILEKYRDCFNTNCNQFGFKKKHSTDMAVFTLKEVIDFYNSSSTPVYACMLDSSKAFDRVNHFHLFSKLLKRNAPKLLIRILYIWYKTQTFAVIWNNCTSVPFTVCNGVRQGGVLSPFLFNIFMEDLSDILCDTKIGCFINGNCFNHICYADDAVLLAPSPEALQMLINLCYSFSCVNDMKYNVKKSVLLAFMPPKLSNLHLPTLYLDEVQLNWVSQHKYLGVVICTDGRDNEDIGRQIKSVYLRGNILFKHFKSCNNDIKIELYRTYILNMYSCQLWCNYSLQTYNRLKVAFNNSFRALMGITRGDSISQIYVRLRITNFSALVRKSVYGTYVRLMNSGNRLVASILSSVHFNCNSKMLKKWCELLLSTAQ